MLLNNAHARLKGLFNNIHWAWGEELFQYNCIITFEFCCKYIYFDAKNHSVLVVPITCIKEKSQFPQ